MIRSTFYPWLAWFIFINILFTLTASFLKTCWKTTFAVSPALIVYFCSIPLLYFLQYLLCIAIKWLFFLFLLIKSTFCYTTDALYTFLSHIEYFIFALCFDMNDTQTFDQTESVSLAQSLKSTVLYKSVWTSLRTRIVQVTQHFVISSPFPRLRQRLPLCSNNIQFPWDSRSLSIFSILFQWSNCKAWNCY